MGALMYDSQSTQLNTRMKDEPRVQCIPGLSPLSLFLGACREHRALGTNLQCPVTSSLGRIIHNMIIVAVAKAVGSCEQCLSQFA